jgi:hypothetical protein
MSRLSRQQYGQIEYDARACYDRILPNIAALASQKYGVHKDLVNLHYITLTAPNKELKSQKETKDLCIQTEAQHQSMARGKAAETVR